MRTAAILPVKRFDRAKSRLGESVADPLRGQLASAMVDDVLSALERAAKIERTYVVSCEPRMAQSAREHGALLVPDRHELGQSAAVALGVQRALADGMQRVLCIPGDCPALDPREVDALLDTERASARGAPEVVIVPDRHGTGTNGLLLRPPDAIEPSFGAESCKRHDELARDAGVRCRIEHPASLLLDIDTGADLDVLRDRLDATHAPGLRTRAVLGERERTQTLSVLHGD
jgi:2-phospho-L-lactate/phosphoenolpyruvate guanylyltransferase